MSQVSAEVKASVRSLGSCQTGAVSIAATRGSLQRGHLDVDLGGAAGAVQVADLEPLGAWVAAAEAAASGDRPPLDRQRVLDLGADGSELDAAPPAAHRVAVGDERRAEPAA